MNIRLLTTLSDQNLDAAPVTHQRQLAISLNAVAETLQGPQDRHAPLNLCLILDHSGSMSGRPLQTVKQAAQSLIDRLQPGDRIAIVVFDHRAKVLVPNQEIDKPAEIHTLIQRLEPQGGTAIDEGMKLGIEELAMGKKGAISQAFLLTDGENEHGDNARCLQLARLAADYNVTLNSLGFGSHWNQDVLEQIADAGGGSLTFIEQPDDALEAFNQLFDRVTSVGLTNAHLLLTLMPGVRLADLKPLAQVAPETIELSILPEGDIQTARLGDLMTDTQRTILANLYIEPLPLGTHTIATVQVRYDNPALHQEGLVSEKLPVVVTVTETAQPQVDAAVQQNILALAKYRQTQIAETKLQQGDRTGAATMLQTAAKTALQMGDQGAATVLQHNATQLQSGEELTEHDRKKTRIVSKTLLK